SPPLWMLAVSCSPATSALVPFLVAFVNILKLNCRFLSPRRLSAGQSQVDRLRSPAPARDAKQKAHADQHRQQVRPAVTDKRQRQAFVRQCAGNDADVDESLQSNQKAYARAEQQAEEIGRV